MEKKAIISVGNAYDGITLHGPFDDVYQAGVWAEQEIGSTDEWHLIMVNSVDLESIDDGEI